MTSLRIAGGRRHTVGLIALVAFVAIAFLAIPSRASAAKVRQKLVSAIVLGGEVTVKDGSDVGGDFQNVPSVVRHEIPKYLAPH